MKSSTGHYDNSVNNNDSNNKLKGLYNKGLICDFDKYGLYYTKTGYPNPSVTDSLLCFGFRCRQIGVLRSFRKYCPRLRSRRKNVLNNWGVKLGKMIKLGSVKILKYTKSLVDQRILYRLERAKELSKFQK